jgi:RHS repeat-associated protein
MTTAHSTMVQGFAVDPDTNQLGSICAAGVDGCFTGVYDPATGNQLGRATSGEYIWDAAGMLTELHTARAERYVYDANDERILVIDSVSGRQRYVLRNGDNKVARELTFLPSSNQWTLAKDYVYRGGTLMASFSGTQATPDRHYHVDHLGTTRVVTDAAGFRLALHTYWPFGPEADGSESDSERLKFTGHERDATPGTTPGFDLDYMHARYYDANAGRFLAVDPTWVSADKGDPQSWNRYAYVGNDPVNKIDPDGKNPVGMLLSGAINVGIESIRQIRSGNPVDNTRLFAALGAGLVSGAIGPIGSGLRGVLAGGAVAGMVSGTIQRVAAGQKTTALDVVVDAGTGAAGRGLARGAAKMMIGGSENAGKLNQLMWQGAAQRAESAAANTGLGADKLTAQAVDAHREGLTRAGGAVGGILAKDLKAEIKDLQQELKK